MKNEEKLTFWRKLKYSIFDFEKYQDLAAEKIGRTIVYIVLLMVIFNIVAAGVYSYEIYEMVGDAKTYISDNIETISFEENTLSVVPKNNEEEIVITENETMPVNISINTNLTDKEEIENYIKEKTEQQNTIIILKDKIVIKNDTMTSPYTYEYSEIAEQYNIDYLNKQELLNLLSGENLNAIIGTSFVVAFIYLFIIYVSSILVDILIFSILGYIVTVISRIRIKYSAVYNIASYALTLPIILNIIYFVVNNLTGFEIKYFRVMYIAITSIYIITAILMIKTDVIKKQMELARIIEEQEKVREEIKRREEQEKEEAEKERQRKEDEEKLKQKEEGQEQEKKKERKKSKKPDVNIGKEPEGNNV